MFALYPKDIPHNEPYKLDSFWLPDGVYAWKTVVPLETYIDPKLRERYINGPLNKTRQAECLVGYGHMSGYKPHETPSLWTHGGTPGCGFYGMKLERTPPLLWEKAWRVKAFANFADEYQYEMPNELLAVVKLSGTIVEHEIGYRASEQTILEYGPDWTVVKPYNSMLARKFHARKLLKWFDYVRKEYGNG